MLRSKKSTCTKNNIVFTCYDSTEDESDFVLKNGQIVKWQTTDQNDEQWWFGYITQYPGSGLTVDMGTNLTSNRQTLTRIKNNNMIDERTRLVTFDFNTYIPTDSTFVVTRIALEITQTGAIRPVAETKTWHFWRYVDTYELAVDGLLLIFIIWFTFEEIYEFYVEKWSIYKTDKWNYLDILNLVFFYVTITIRYFEYDYSKNLNLLSMTTYVSFQSLQFWHRMETYAQMVNGFLLYIKMFKYMTFSDRVRFLFRMFQRSQTDIFVFTLVIIVFVFAFGMTGYLSFSQDVSDFRTFGHSIANLGRYIISDLNYDELIESHRIIGSFFYFMWGILILLILANVFIAILSDSYSVISGEFGDEHIFEKLNVLNGTKSLLRGLGHMKNRLSVRNSIQLKNIKLSRLNTKFSHENDEVNVGDIAQEIAPQIGRTKTEVLDVVKDFDENQDKALSKQEFENFKHYVQTGQNNSKHSQLDEDLSDVKSELSDLMQKIETIGQHATRHIKKL